MEQRKRGAHTAGVAEVLETLTVLGCDTKQRFPGISTPGSKQDSLLCWQCLLEMASGRTSPSQTIPPLSFPSTTLVKLSKIFRLVILTSVAEIKDTRVHYWAVMSSLYVCGNCDVAENGPIVHVCSKNLLSTCYVPASGDTKMRKKPSCQAPGRCIWATDKIYHLNRK